MNLDPQQQSAVEATSKRSLVIAGAGSGKTRVLISRIAHLLESCQVSPYEVMSFTFTRKAAAEMRERLESAIGPRAHRVTMGTMHALALQMIRRFGEMIGLRPDNITVYGEFEEQFLLKEVAMELGYFKKSWKMPKRDIQELFRDYYERGKEPIKDHPASELFYAFLGHCRENNSLTYGMLLHVLERLIPTMARHLHIKHILVDEVQDIDPMQWRIINGMCEAFGASLFAVGDVDQSIYAFRGAVPEYLVDHQKDFDVFLLESNYRSVPNIVEAANRLIANNAARISKTMKATREELFAVYSVENQDAEAMAKAFTPFAEGHGMMMRGKPVELQDIAILARNHVLLRRLDDELTAREIPHVYVGRKTTLTNSEEFRRFHAFLKLIENPYDNFSFLLIRELIGLSPKDYAEIRYIAAVEGRSHFQVFMSAKGVWQDFFREDWLLGNAINVLSPNIDIDLHATLEFIEAYLESNKSATIAQYLDWLATWDIQDEIKNEPGGITLSTIHGAKGLEWPVVILAGCNEGLLPSKQAVANGEVEEERRLAYVAMTRARDSLILAVRPERKEAMDGKIYENPVSRFVQEALQEGAE